MKFGKAMVQTPAILLTSAGAFARRDKLLYCISDADRFLNSPQMSQVEVYRLLNGLTVRGKILISESGIPLISFGDPTLCRESFSLTS